MRIITGASVPVPACFAQNAGIPLVKHFQDAKVVDESPAGGHLGAAGRAIADLLGNDLATLTADLHKEISPKLIDVGYRKQVISSHRLLNILIGRLCRQLLMAGGLTITGTRTERFT
jgi:hypothetical protein